VLQSIDFSKCAGATLFIFACYKSHHTMKTVNIFIAVLCAVIFSSTTYGAILRVNSTPGMAAPYTSLSSAAAAAAPGDTIYIEGAATVYSGASISKPLVLIGPGYFLNESNPRTQANATVAELNYIIFDVGSKGSVAQGLKISSTYVKDSFVTIQRCLLASAILNYSNTTTYGDTIRNCYITGSVSTSGTVGHTKSLMFYNNISVATTPISLNSASSGFVVNNVFGASTNLFSCSNMLFQNNIFKSPSFTSYLTLNAFYNNIACNAAGIPSGNGNVLGATWDDLFISDTSATSDGKFQLAPTSIAIDAGDLNGADVDCGAFGGPAPYILSGMPNVPSIYYLDVPEIVPVGTETILIKIGASAH
jgi:hypothetical protein